MTRRRKKIDPRQRAGEVLRELGIVSPPVEVDEIVAQAGITVRYMPLEDDLSGMIFSNSGVPMIVVNSLHHPNRQRFTLAHEFGHFELHMADIGSEVHVDKKYLMMARDGLSAQGFDRQEIEANRFAAEILVPWDLLTSELRDRSFDVEDETLVAELARTFQVSRQMMAIRIGELAESNWK